jgi:hypothetical protein
MALQPGIILAGQTPDIIGALDRSTQAASNRNALTRQNALEQLYRTQGAGIAAGEAGAVNALAGYDPYAAMQVQDTVTQRQRQATADSRGDQEWQWKVEEYAAGKSAAERAAEAAQIEESVKMGLAATSPQQWDQMMAQLGADDLIGQFDNRQAIANRYLSVAEILKGQAPPDPTKGAPSGYTWLDPANPAAGVKPLPGYQKGPLVTVNNGSEVGTIPQGYELFTDPNTGARSLRPIAGGPEDRSKADAAAAADQAQKSNLLTEDIGRAKAIINESPWLTTGLLGGILKSWGGTPAADTAALLDTIGANIAFDRLQAMRDSSPTGGALGQVTERELALLQATAGAIAQSQSAEQLLFNLTRLEQQISEVVNGPGGQTRRPQSAPPSQSGPPPGIDPEVWDEMTPDEKALFP